MNGTCHAGRIDQQRPMRRLSHRDRMGYWTKPVPVRAVVIVVVNGCLVEQDYGSELVDDVARSLVVYLKPCASQPMQS